MGKANKLEKKRAKGEVTIAKAEVMMDSGDFKKAANLFQKGGEIFFDLGEWKIAEQAFFYAGKNFIKLEKYAEAAALQRLAANCCLLVQNFAKARDYYDLSLKAYLKSGVKNQDEMVALTMSFAYLCHFILGQQDEALGYIKRFKKSIDPDIFANHPLVQLIRNLSNAILNENEDYLESVFEAYPHYKFRAAEGELIRAAILVAMCSVYLDYSLNFEENELETDKIIQLNTKIDISRINDIEQHNLLPHIFKTLKITNIGFSLGDNTSIHKKPDFPISILKEFKKGKKELFLPIDFRTNFPGKGYLGPFVVSVEIDGIFNFFLKTEALDITVTSPAAILGIELIPQRTPVVNQTFPVEVRLYNQSEGDAQEISVEFVFPEDIRLMRGTFQKNIYALRPNEEFKWQIQLKAFDIGQIPILTKVKFKDGDGNSKGPFEAELPIEINM